MVTVRDVPPDAPGLALAVRALDDASIRSSGHEALNGAVWADLAHPTADSVGFVVRADAAVPHGADPGAGDATGDPPVVAYAHLSVDGSVETPTHSLGLVIDPASDPALLVPALLGAAAGRVAQRGGGRIVLWIMGVDDTTDTHVTAGGFVRAREQHQMHARLPTRQKPRWPSTVTVRTFEPGRDEEAWVAVNNRAFAGHAEQGGWTVDTLRQREQEPWFDPSGFLLAADADGLAGFCWTKVHDTEPSGDREGSRVGEIYVIAVDPGRQGIGLGRALVLGGLDHLHRAQHCDTGMLYVAADNTAAVALYKALGFSVTRSDRAYERVVSAA